MPHPKIVLIGEDIGLYDVTVYPIAARMKEVMAKTVLLMDATNNKPYDPETIVFYLCLKPNGQVDGILDENWTPVIGPRRPAYNPDQLKAFCDSIPMWVMPTILDVGPLLNTRPYLRPINCSMSELQARTSAPQGGVAPLFWLAHKASEDCETRYELMTYDLLLTRTHEVMQHKNGQWLRVPQSDLCDYCCKTALRYFAECDEAAQQATA